jgi:hypothetical protein
MAEQVQEPPRLQDHIDGITGVEKGPQYREAMQQFKEMYEQQALEGERTLAEVHDKKIDQWVDSEGRPRWNEDGSPKGYIHEARYDARTFEYENGTLTEINVKVHIENMDPLNGSMKALKETVYTGVEKYYNEPKHELPNGDRLHVNVEFVDKPEDAHMKVEAHPGIAVDPDQGQWPAKMDPVVPAHEIGHQLNFNDEYKAKGTVKRGDDNSPFVFKDGSVMADPRQRDAQGNVVVDPATGLDRTDPNAEFKRRHMEQLQTDIERARARRSGQ